MQVKTPRRKPKMTDYERKRRRQDFREVLGLFVITVLALAVGAVYF
jgi:hypothetical protein